jgi:hypothetical protein
MAPKRQATAKKVMPHQYVRGNKKYATSMFSQTGCPQKLADIGSVQSSHSTMDCNEQSSTNSAINRSSLWYRATLPSISENTICRLAMGVMNSNNAVSLQRHPLWRAIQILGPHKSDHVAMCLCARVVSHQITVRVCSASGLSPRQDPSLPFGHLGNYLPQIPRLGDRQAPNLTFFLFN